MNLDDALKTFVIESRELLESMEEALLRVEQSPGDRDLIAAIFRAAHTIKGSAGLFGLDHVVSFTHNAENVLDMVRSGELGITGELVALFLQVCDHMGLLVDHIEAGTEPTVETHARSAELVGSLKTLAGRPAAEENTPPVRHETPLERDNTNYGEGVESDNWHLSLRFGADVLKHGMDPVAFIRYLTTFGRIVTIVTLTESIPGGPEMDPECCYLGFEINFRSDADKQTIESAFEFVRDDARIRILPPHSKIDEYLELINGLPEEEMRLGEILVRCGTLTQAEIDAALATQAAARDSGEREPAIGEVLLAQQVVQPAVVDAALQKQRQVKESKQGDAALIRVNAEKLDEHINQIGELIIASAGINLAALKTGIPELLEAASVMNRLVENIRDSALQLRMIQIGATFNKFQRVVRDVSKEIGKDIRLEISGAETELDKTVIEKIGDPLTHLVRNSMDHGIEAAELRLARGKPAHGTLRLNAYHDSGSIAIEVSDDGGGLPRERILAKAIERGLVKPDQVLSDNEIHNLIFEPGFSTAEQVNNLSGRGVGMDVVRRNITALRGSIEIESVEGRGTTMRIRLPLTLAIIDGFLVGVGNSSFVVPLEMVVECVELTDDEIAAAQGRDQLNLRGEVLPFIRLRDLFGIPEAPPPERSEAEKLLLASVDEELAFLLQPIKRENVVVVNYAGMRAGLVVDMLQGEYQTVIRPLGAVFNGLQGVSGFTILGSGQVALILDIPGLIRRVADSESRRNRQLTKHRITE
ncbi:two-component system chemotaxis sensor kinase CheA [Azonexus fungiphilus]|uniref:Chemotaxis protein CheA n=1 Tax=Azonexus fungiphilus TaxID=146940 RepID=A0A495WE60_9RHOO|nr:chemotaxis protein CheA [Azonexus fungiphilus]RKT58078.1 two-component system chemotaxis sensor kinase CheA [Azonexus fungiphilus]